MKNDTIKDCISTVGVKECIEHEVWVGACLERRMGFQYHVGDGITWEGILGGGSMVRWQKGTLWWKIWRGELCVLGWHSGHLSRGAVVEKARIVG